MKPKHSNPLYWKYYRTGCKCARCKEWSKQRKQKFAPTKLTLNDLKPIYTNKAIASMPYQMNENGDE